MSQTNYMQVIDPKIAEIKGRIALLKLQVNDIWDLIKAEDAALRVICGCRSGDVVSFTSPNGIDGVSMMAPTYCDYHKPVMMNESRA